MAISQTITAIPEAGHRGVDSRNDFVTKQEAFQDSLTEVFVAEINTFATEANTLKDEVNTLKSDTQSIKDLAVDAKDDAVLAKIASELARDEAVGAISVLPDGIINDGTVSATDTWSSSKIDTDKQDTLVSGTNIKTIGGASVLGGGDLVVGATDYQEFTTSGTWTKPDGINYVYVECLGGGGSGSTNTDTSDAPGGSGGEYVNMVFLATSLSATVAVTIGAGGAGGLVGVHNGVKGGDTTFGSYITAIGGSGGVIGSPYTPIPRANTTSATSAYYVMQAIPLPQAGYGYIQFGGNTIYGGGGGGGAGTLYRAGGLSQFAGNGGSGTNNDSGVANGLYPAGGGGGSNSNASSGNGANGRVRVWAW